MKPEDKQKLADAWRKAMDRNPYVDDPTGIFLADGTPLTQRKALEFILASEATYRKVDALLEAYPGVTLDDFIGKKFGPYSIAEVPIVVRHQGNPGPQI